MIYICIYTSVDIYVYVCVYILETHVIHDYLVLYPDIYSIEIYAIYLEREIYIYIYVRVLSI